MWAIAEQIYSQLVTHSVVTLIIGKLNKRDHLLDRSKSFDALFITMGLNDGLADLFETSWIKINTQINCKRLEKSIIMTNVAFLNISYY